MRGCVDCASSQRYTKRTKKWNSLPSPIDPYKERRVCGKCHKYQQNHGNYLTKETRNKRIMRKCTTKDNVMNLNVNLLKAPENVIDYTILHELCHVKIKKYSHHSWDTLHKFRPDYQVQIDWLRINGSILV
jgi:predicted metal-dependent hydrolase